MWRGLSLLSRIDHRLSLSIKRARAVSAALETRSMNCAARKGKKSGMTPLKKTADPSSRRHARQWAAVQATAGSLGPQIRESEGEGGGGQEGAFRQRLTSRHRY